jgi:hypothetical protein
MFTVLIIVIFLLGLFERQSSQEYKTEQQKDNIPTEIVNISAKHLQGENQNLVCQCKECLHVEGRNF